MSYNPINEISVGLDFGENEIHVGRLAQNDNGIFFQYDDDFIQRGLEISPLRLPLKPGVTAFDHFLFEGLAGVFNDSLPDGWGRLLLDRALRQRGILPNEVTPLDRLASVGKSGMGALTYQPDHSEVETIEEFTLDMLSTHTKNVLAGSSQDVLNALIALNGSSAGAHPKALIGVSKARNYITHGQRNLPKGYEHWLVKFSNVQDGPDAGAIEYVYSLMARQAGVEIPETYLFPSKHGPGYFAIKRFDRVGKKRFHTHTASGLLHSDFRTPSLDYEDLLALTEILTKDVREVEKMYRLAVFNVMAHNRDDHAKNFTYIMDESGVWRLSLAYDLTFSSGPRGEQSTMVLGEGRNLTLEHLLLLSEKSTLGRKKAHEIIDQTREALENFSELSKSYGISCENQSLIEKRLLRK